MVLRSAVRTLRKHVPGRTCYIHPSDQRGWRSTVVRLRDRIVDRIYGRRYDPLIDGSIVEQVWSGYGTTYIKTQSGAVFKCRWDHMAWREVMRGSTPFDTGRS